MLQHLWVGKKAVGRCWDVNLEGVIQSECFFAWACPIHLRGTHLPQCQMQTLATFEQGRTISFLLRVCQMFCAIRTQSSACWRQSLGWIRMTVVSTSPIQGEVGKSGPFVTEGPLSLRQRLARGATRTNTKHKPPDRGQEG